MTAKKSTSGIFRSQLTQNFVITPTVQEEANRKWSYIKYAQYGKVWALMNPDIQQLIPEDKYVAELQQNISQVTNDGGNLGSQTIASVTDLNTWTEPTTGITYHNVKELQITDPITVLGVTNNTNFVSHWVKRGDVWTFFANPKDPSYQAQ
jgi:hypothetical protein